MLVFLKIFLDHFDGIRVSQKTIYQRPILKYMLSDFSMLYKPVNFNACFCVASKIVIDFSYDLISIIRRHILQ